MLTSHPDMLMLSIKGPNHHPGMVTKMGMTQMQTMKPIQLEAQTVFEGACILKLNIFF
jgi:hypothetical protein